MELLKFTAQKMKFSIKDFFSKCDLFPADLVTFTEEILNEKLRFLCSGYYHRETRTRKHPKLYKNYWKNLDLI